MEVNVEKIVQLKPDLVITTSLNDLRVKAKLMSMKINVFEYSYPKTFGEICGQFTQLGIMLGKKQKAEEILAETRIKVKTVTGSVKNTRRPKVFMQIGAKPLWSVPKDNFMNDLIEMAGGINISSISKTGLYSYEQVLKNDPDIIFISDMGISAEKETAKWKKYATINAVKNDRIYLIDSYELCSSNPVFFAKTLETMTRRIREK